MNIERLRGAVALWSSIPAAEWNMDLYYFMPNHCGCALGNLAMHHYDGWKMEDNVPANDKFPKTCFLLDTAFATARAYFEMDKFDTEIFHRIDKRIPSELPMPNHKQIFFLRLDKLLADKGIPMSAVYGPEQREQNDPLDDPDKLLEHPQVEQDDQFA